MSVDQPSIFDAPQRCLSLRQAARYLRVRLEKVKLHIRRGELAAADLAGPGERSCPRIAPSAIEAFLRARTIKAKQARRERVDPEIAAILGDE
jgi:hypothetical protein